MGVNVARSSRREWEKQKKRYKRIRRAFDKYRDDMKLTA